MQFKSIHNPGSKMLTKAQIETIKATTPVVKEHGNTVTSVFYKNLLDEKPQLNEVFNQGNQFNGHQAKALAGAVLSYASNIDNLDVLTSAIERITQKHASLFIQPDQYQVVGEYLLKAFATVLGAAFTPEIREAWAAAYGQLAQIMIEAEAKLYDAARDWTGWRDFIIRDKIPEAENITSFILSPVDGRPLQSYLPGQYVSVKVDVPTLHYSQARQYSLSDKHFPDHYRISVKKEPGLEVADPEGHKHPGYVSSVLHDAKSIGDHVRLSQPRGEFYLDTSSHFRNPLVLMSAGVGVTPLMSILDTVLAEQPSRQISWIHGARTVRDMAFAAHVRDQANSHTTLRHVLFVKNVMESDRSGSDYHHTGRVNLEVCDKERDLVVSDASTLYYVCGPASFMTTIREGLQGYGVDASRIKLEVFGTGDVDTIS